MTSSSQKSAPIKLAILLFDGVEVLDFCGPFEVFSITGERFNGLITVQTFAEKQQIVTRNGLKVIVDELIDLENLPEIDVLLIPGGQGTRVEYKNQKLINWIKKITPNLRHILSVCTGVLLLGSAELINRLNITTHHGAYELVQKEFPACKVCKCRRYIDNGFTMSSAGISAGIDLSFYFVRKLFGADIANGVAKVMEYDWKDEEYRNTCNC